jgi:DNA polymerase/3'-5' exonuclease PolX
MSDCKATIVEAFGLLLNLEKGSKKTGAAFAARNYKAALEKLALVDAVKTVEDLKTLRGKAKDGGSMYQRAVQILETGTCDVLEEKKEDKDVWAAYDVFLEVHGIGPAMAYELAADGYRTIEDLKKAVASGTLTLNKTQTIGLTYHDNILERIPRAEMLEHEAILKEVAAKAGCPQMDIAGSFRRGRPDSGDIDMLLCSKDSKMMDAMVKALTERHYIREKLAHGAHKFMGICKLGKLPFRRLDILLTPPEEYGIALLHFTGSEKFNVLVRHRANALGYTLNEHCLSLLPKWKGAERKAIPVLRTEAEILAFLGIQFVKPQDRETIKSLELIA